MTDYLTNTLQMSLTPTNPEENLISLLSTLYFDNPKLKKIFELKTHNKYVTVYLERSYQYYHRLEVMEKIHSLLPQIVSKIAVDLIKKYVSLGFQATYSIGPLETCLDLISLALVDEFKVSVDEYHKTQNTTLIEQPKYKPLAEFHNLFILFNSQLISGFKKAYMTYKQYLTLILETNYMLSGNSVMYYKNIIMQYIVSINMPLQPLDHHVFLQLLRIQLVGSYPNDLFPFPTVSTEQSNQLNSYLEEIIHIIFINIIVSEKYNIPQHIFTALPLTLTINKKPKEFFGKPLSKNTFSILLEYLGNVNKALTVKTLEYFKTIKK